MSPLQKQYPLSPLKFWKKMIPQFVVVAVLVLIIGAGVSTLEITIGMSETFNFFSPTLLIGLLALYAAIMWLYAWYVRVYIQRYYYDAGDHFITIKKGVFAPQEIHVQYAKVQDVYVDQDILDRVMGLYDVHIASATASSAMEAHIDGVEHDAAEGLKNLLLERVQGGGSAATASPAPQAHVQDQPVQPVKLTEEVSTKNYPLLGIWIVQSIVGYVFQSAIYAGFITFWLMTPGRNSDQSPADLFGLQSISVGISFFVVILAFHVVYLLIWKSVYYFEFLPEYILQRTGVISRSEVHVPYRSIQDVNVTQGIIERLFGLATVFIENAAATKVVGKKVVKSGVSIPGQSLEKANHIAEVVRKVLLTKNTSQTGL